MTAIPFSASSVVMGPRLRGDDSERNRACNKKAGPKAGFRIS